MIVLGTLAARYFDPGDLAVIDADRFATVTYGEVVLWENDRPTKVIAEVEEATHLIVVGSTLFVAGEDLVALGLDGTERWRADLGRGYTTSLATDGRRIAVGRCDTSAGMVEYSTSGKRLGSKRGPEDPYDYKSCVEGVAYGPDGVLMVGRQFLLHGDQKLRVDGVAAKAIAVKGREVLIGGTNDAMNVWNLDTGKAVRAYGWFDGWTEQAIWRGDRIYAQHGSIGRIWDPKTRRPLVEWEGKAPFDVGPDGLVQVVNGEVVHIRGNKRTSSTLPFHVEAVRAIAVTGESVLTSGRDGAREWKADGTHVGQHVTDPMPYGGYGIAANGSRTLIGATLYDAGKAVHTFPGAGRQAWLGDVVVLRTDDGHIVYDLDGTELARTEDEVLFVEGGHVYLDACNGIVRWDPRTDRRTELGPAETCISAAAMTGEVIIASTGNGVMRYDGDWTKVIDTDVYALDFDGRHILTGGQEAHLWSRDGKHLRELDLRGRNADVVVLDGDRALTSAGNAVLIWTIP